MGLDMYAYKVKKEEVAYWRKHNRLHGWFEKEYHKANPNEAGDFNCKDFYLTEEILDRLEKDINSKTLPKTAGFFYGDDSYSYTAEEIKDMQAYDLAFVANAKKILEEGDHIAYSCWW
jgi:hypothetical protein